MSSETSVKEVLEAGQDEAHRRGWNAALTAVEDAVGAKRRPAAQSTMRELDMDAGWNDLRDVILRRIAALRKGA